MTDNATSQSENVVSILNQLKSKQKAPDAPDTAEPLRAYRAYGVDAPQRRPSIMSIHYRNGVRGGVQKRFFQEYMLSSHQYLSLVFTNCIITIEGKNLEPLADLLEDEKIFSLHCFDPKIHDQPPEEEIVIFEIIRRSARDLSAYEKKKEAVGR